MMPQPLTTVGAQDQVFDRLALTNLPGVAGGLGFIFFVFAFLNLVSLGVEVAAPVAAGNLVAASFATAVALAARRGWVGVRRAVAATAAVHLVSVVVILNAYRLLDDPLRMVFVSLAVVSAGWFVHSLPWLLSVIVSAVGGWAVVSGLLIGDTVTLGQGVFYLLGSALLALVVHRVGRRNYRQVVAAVESSQRATAELRSRDELLRQVAEHGDKVFWAYDLQTRSFTYLSPGFASMSGRAMEDLYARPEGFFDLCFPEDEEALRELLRQTVASGRVKTDHRLRHRDGSERWVHLEATLVEDSQGGGLRIVGIAEDVTARKRREQVYERLASVDALTGLCNRRCFDEALTDEWKRHVRNRGALALLIVDVDRFKQVNDAYGHAAGDRCLKATAGALQRSTKRGSDLVARIGGEEFAVLLPDTGFDGAREIATRIHDEVGALSIEHDGASIAAPSVSIGLVSAVPTLDGTPAEMVERADEALYAAKRAGRNRTEVAAGSDRTPRRLNLVVGALAAALLGALLAGCAAEPPRAEPPVPAVEAVAARVGALPLEQRLSGVVKAENQVAVHPEIEATVAEVYVRTGDAVRRGQPLVRLVGDELGDRLRQAAADLRLAEASSAEARARVAEVAAQATRSRALAAEELISELEAETLAARLDAAEASARQAEAAVAQAEAVVAERRSALGKTTVRSPVAGRVGQRRAEAGMRADPSTPLFVVGNLDELIVEVPLTERMLGHVREGQAVRIAAPGLDEPLAATLSRISPFLAAGSFSTVGEIDLASPGGRLLPGAFVTVDVLYGESDEATLVPTSALWDDPGSGVRGVWVVGSGAPLAGREGLSDEPYAVAFRAVEVVAEGRGAAGVTGVGAGEWVVTVGQHLLAGAGSEGEAEARVRPTTWARVEELQGLQREDLLRGFLAKQQAIARQRGAVPPSNEEFLGTGSGAADGGERAPEGG